MLYRKKIVILAFVFFKSFESVASACVRCQALTTLLQKERAENTKKMAVVQQEKDELKELLGAPQTLLLKTREEKKEADRYAKALENLSYLSLNTSEDELNDLINLVAFIKDQNFDQLGTIEQCKKNMEQDASVLSGFVKVHAGLERILSSDLLCTFVLLKGKFFEQDYEKIKAVARTMFDFLEKTKLKLEESL